MDKGEPRWCAVGGMRDGEKGLEFNGRYFIQDNHFFLLHLIIFLCQPNKKPAAEEGEFKSQIPKWVPNEQHKLTGQPTVVNIWYMGHRPG